ncbi:MAG: tetratricopeptide repeat protein [Thermoguttaceae bacterium]|nr:tetratricopeptide repeat protein [Thermoguttaceae bacterium]
MNCRCSRFPVLLDIYQRYLLQANMSDFKSEVSRCYTAGTLERLVSHSDASVRRAAVLALGSTGEMSSVRILVSALRDADRTVAILAENALHSIWNRAGDESDQRMLQNLSRMVSSGEAAMAVTFASLQLEKTPRFAEIWFQRASAWFELGEYEYAREDLETVLDLNPFHFDAYVLLGYVHMETGRTVQALRAFRNALDINPGLKNTQLRKRTSAFLRQARSN